MALLERASSLELPALTVPTAFHVTIPETVLGVLQRSSTPWTITFFKPTDGNFKSAVRLSLFRLSLSFLSYYVRNAT